MPLTKEQKQRLIEAYEPILYFHPDEGYVPVKPDVYVEASALWCSQPPSHDKRDWDACKGSEVRDVFPKEPLIEKGKITVNPGLHDGASKFLGFQEADGFLPFLVSNRDRELFFDMAAWQDSEDVTDTSENKSCSTERATERWRDEEPLRSAVDWYYAEVEELDTLTDILALLREGSGPDLGEALRKILGKAWFIWYYFLYPIHLEDPRGCEKIVGVGDHGNYEGDWNAIGVIVREPLTLPWESGSFPEPEWIGFGRRARGLVENFVPFFRQQMDVRSWAGGEVRRVGTHPKVFVANGSHNNYPVAGPQDPPTISVSDAACGVTEDVDEAIKEKLDELEDTIDTVKTVVVTVAKVAGGCGIGAIFGGPLGCLIGAAVGGIAAAIEAAADSDDEESTPVDDAVAEELERDHPPDPGNYGLVLVPQFLETTLPDASEAASVRPWAGTPDHHIVDRELQVWWPGERNDPGYGGRWGVMCQEDPYDRRSGITFPDFKRAFLLDLALRLSS